MSTPNCRWTPPQPIACPQLGSRHSPLHRLRQPYEQGRRPYDLGLVLTVASDREIRRDRLRRLLRIGLAIGFAAIATSMLLKLRGASPWLSSAITTVHGLSEQLEVRAPGTASGLPLQPISLSLEGTLRDTTDRGY